MNKTADFIFVVCQHGAEAATRQEITLAHPNLRLAFSRPGFVTFKVDPDAELPERFSLRSTLARTYGWSLGKTTQDTESDAHQMVAQIIEQQNLDDFDHIHVWQRDAALPGKQGFEPGVTALASEIGELFKQQLADNGHAIPVNQITQPDESVFDVVIVEPDQWWFGHHFATTVAQRWPGGVPPLDTSIETVSRAYFKAQEALLWSGVTISPGDCVAEIGSAPGGCCQLLLERGAKVIGIDPAEMQEELLAEPNFVHIRRRGREIKKRDLKDVKWLFADISMVPQYTLDTIEEIVSNENVDVRGLILTMKLTDWKLVDEIPQQMKRVREMGFSVVKSRQLAFNRKEFCLFAAKDKFVLRIGKKKKKTAKKSGSKKKRK